MAADIIDGKAISASIRDELAGRIDAVKKGLGRPPGLVILLVGDDPASGVYVRSKLKTGEEAGMRVHLETLPASASLDDVLGVVARYNADDAFDGILVQSPLPPALGRAAEKQVFDAIDPGKDVDGFSPISAGLVSQNRDGFAPCTPAGVIEMLERSNIEIAGKHAVVVGRSDIVGKPMAMLLLHRNATVSICHSRTPDLGAITRQADILVAAVGRPAMLKPEHVKPGATVIDVGINAVTEKAQAEEIFANHPKRLAVFNKRGTVLVGDVHPDVAEVAGAISPVPGGVGPLTIAMLMANTVKSAENKLA
jgi:methylenetetrahydrofolate dehydrogenase (NADP+)/methenyltetrahydrofolate cyclohydrolase